MKLTDNAALDFIDQDILSGWGYPSYEATLVRLAELSRITPDPDIKVHIRNLMVKLILHMDSDRYEQLNIHQYFPLCRHKNRIIRLICIISLDIMLVSILLITMTIILSIISQF